MKRKLILCGLKLFVLGYRITFVQKLVNWRANKVKSYSDPMLIKLSHWYTGLCTRFMRLEQEFNEIKSQLEDI